MLDAMRATLAIARPTICNSDQVSHFTGTAFIRDAVIFLPKQLSSLKAES
jgi:hypothetical protein